MEDYEVIQKVGRGKYSEVYEVSTGFLFTVNSQKRVYTLSIQVNAS